MSRTEQRSERALPRAAGETRAGAALRRDARMQCARALRDAFDAACASLCKDTADAAAQFIRAPRREGDVRVAVVRAGFCGRCRGVAAAALASALHRANVKALRVEDRWQLNDENDEEAAVVVARAEATGAAGLRDALAALGSTGAFLVASGAAGSISLGRRSVTALNHCASLAEGGVLSPPGTSGYGKGFAVRSATPALDMSSGSGEHAHGAPEDAMFCIRPPRRRGLLYSTPCLLPPWPAEGRAARAQFQCTSLLQIGCDRFTPALY